MLDEVDRLLDLGFEQSILEVLSTIRGVRLPGLKDKEVRVRYTVLLYAAVQCDMYEKILLDMLYDMKIKYRSII